MNALLLTQQQAAALETANGDSTRRLQPRQLADARLILSADALTDPLFSDPANPWLETLTAATPIVLTEADLAES